MDGRENVMGWGLSGIAIGYRTPSSISPKMETDTQSIRNADAAAAGRFFPIAPGRSRGDLDKISGFFSSSGPRSVANV
jgi:hypothetical protein